MSTLKADLVRTERACGHSCRKQVNVRRALCLQARARIARDLERGICTACRRKVNRLIAGEAVRFDA